LGGHDPDIPLRELGESGVVERALGPEPRQVVGRRRQRHRVLVLDAALIGLKRRRHREDGLAVLDRVHPPSSERSAIAQGLNEKNGGRIGISGPQEVAVQRMHLIAIVDRAHRRYQRLARHVATKGALEEAGFGAEHPTAVDVDLELFEIKDLFDRHAVILAVRKSGASRGAYQPRSASRCGAAMSSTLIPTMASPSPRDTLASTS